MDPTGKKTKILVAGKMMGVVSKMVDSHTTQLIEAEEDEVVDRLLEHDTTLTTTEFGTFNVEPEEFIPKKPKWNKPYPPSKSDRKKYSF